MDTQVECPTCKSIFAGAVIPEECPRCGDPLDVCEAECPVSGRWSQDQWDRLTFWDCF